MYILYIDDSGTAELKHDETYCISGGNTRYFVLGAVMLKASELNQKECDIENFKSICFKNYYDEIKFSPDRKRLKCKNNCNSNFNKDCYYKQINELLKNIECTIFSCSQDKYYTTKNNIVNSKKDVYLLSFQNLLSMVDNYFYLNKISESVIVMIDKKDNGNETDTMIYEAYKKAISNEKIFKNYGNTNFAPSINVVYSRYTTGCQLADFVAGSIWSTCEEQDEKEIEIKKQRNEIIKSKTFKWNDTTLNYGYKKCRNFIQ